MQHRPWKKTKFQSTTLIAVVVLLPILFALVGYFFVLPEVERSQQAAQLQDKLATQWGRWQLSRPVAYRYVIERDCYCPGEDTAPYIVTVADNAIAADTPPDAVRIDDLFRIATNAASASRQVEVTFDARFGFPTKLTIDDLQGNRASIEVYRVLDFDVIDYGRPGDSG